MEAFGSTWPVFFGLTVILTGGAAFMTGQALAATWRPWWQAVPYSLLLGGADRFLGYALFQGALLSVPGYLLDTAVVMGICLAAYRITQVRKMVAQYPWIVERTGLFAWREKGLR